MSTASYRRARNVALIGMALATAAWLGPSFLSANRYRRQLESHLSLMLGRSVDFRSASFRLLPRPGFVLGEVVVQEDPRFGSEPFARIGQAACALRLRSLWHGRLDIDALSLDHATLNIVRNRAGEWNVEYLLQQRGLMRSGLSSSTRGIPASLSLEIGAARLNFKIGANKKPFALTDLSARIDFDPAAQAVRYHLTASPIRTDWSLPTPGPLELTGEWRPRSGGGGLVTGTLEAHRAMLYDWVPLATGHNPGIYGVFDATVHFAGPLQSLGMDGRARVEQLHRWESLPPSKDMPVEMRFRGEWNRAANRLAIEDVDATFANSRVHGTGAVNQVATTPQLDLTVSVARSRAVDLSSLAERLLGGAPGKFGLAGRVDGLLLIQGPWRERRYAGSVMLRDGSLKTPAGAFALSPVTLKIGDGGVELEPVRVALARHVVLTATGALPRPAVVGAMSSPPPSRVGARRPPSRSPTAALRQPGSRLRPARTYVLHCSARSVPLNNLLSFLRSLGIPALQHVEAQGTADADFTLSGTVWPLTGRLASGQAEVAGWLDLPGLTQPVELRQARVQLIGNQIVVDPLVAQIGSSAFTGRLQHEVQRKEPWHFALRADQLSLDQAALWFDAISPPSSFRLLDFLPGLRSLADRLAAGADLLASLRAEGSLATPSLSYRSARVRDFHAAVDISNRLVRVSHAAFRVAEGRGRGESEITFAASPPRVRVDAEMEDVKLQTWASRLPPPLRRARGVLAATLHLETRGLSRQALASALEGQAELRLEDVDFGGFDPLDAAARAAALGRLQSARGDVRLRSADATLTVRGRHVFLSAAAVQLTGGLFNLAGSYAFDGTVALRITADLTHVRRRWLDVSEDPGPAARTTAFRLAGRLDKLSVLPEIQAAAIRR